jgi:Bacterial SCP ortholog
MSARLRRADPDAVAAALAHEDRSGAELKLLTKHFLAVLSEQAPGASVEVRVPPYAAAQVIPGVRHTRGTPPAVVEMDAETWVALATGDLAWGEAESRGVLRASGQRADLTAYLPLRQD